jgi:hypothetical protein
MKKIFISGFAAGFVILILSYAGLYATIFLLPEVANEYYDPTYTSDRLWLFVLHPFVMSITFAWFWDKFKSNIQGGWLYRGVWMGLIYGAVATLPAMWLTFSSINVSLGMVVTWFFYGLLCAVTAGVIFSKMNP